MALQIQVVHFAGVGSWDHRLPVRPSHTPSGVHASRIPASTACSHTTAGGVPAALIAAVDPANKSLPEGQASPGSPHRVCRESASQGRQLWTQ